MKASSPPSAPYTANTPYINSTPATAEILQACLDEGMDVEIPCLDWDSTDGTQEGEISSLLLLLVYCLGVVVVQVGVTVGTVCVILGR
jgi:hypothetical protein